MTHRRQRGRAVLKFIGISLGILTAAWISWYGYVEYRRNYWDDRVREMCAKDGGIKVFERVALTDKRYLDADGGIRLPSKVERGPEFAPLPFEAKPDDLFYWQMETIVIRRGAPSIVRNEMRVIRSSDGKLLALATSFGRHGGDLIALEVGSRFRCPPGGETELFRQVFIVSTKTGVRK